MVKDEIEQSKSVWVHAATGGRLRVAFARSGDRFSHRVLWSGDSRLDQQPLLQSVEGTAEESWPASPVLQQLHFEGRQSGSTPSADESPIALLLGQAGRSHWSLSVAPTAEGSSFEFDVACRVTPQSQPILRSSYDCLSAVERVDGNSVHLALSATLRCVVKVDDATTRLQIVERGILIGPTATQGSTRRWKYWLEVK